MDMTEMQDLIVDDRLRGVFRVNRRVFTDPEILEQERREAKAYLYKTLYESKPLLPEKLKAEKVATETFDYLVAHPESLPPSYQEKIEREKLVRVVCDYIAGMTDHYIEDLLKKLRAAASVQ